MAAVRSNKNRTKARLALGAAALGVLLVFGCAPSEGVDPPEPTPTSEPIPTFEPEPTPPPEPTPTTPEPTPTPEPTVDVPRPPDELVGRWNGGPGNSSDWDFTVSADGSYTLVNDYLGLFDSGYVDATSGQLFLVSDTGDSAVAEAAGIQGCPWQLQTDFGMTFLWLCGQAASFVLA
jgi:hypothetical protein